MHTAPRDLDSMSNVVRGNLTFGYFTLLVAGELMHLTRLSKTARNVAIQSHVVKTIFSTVECHQVQYPSTHMGNQGPTANVDMKDPHP